MFVGQVRKKAVQRCATSIGDPSGDAVATLLPRANHSYQFFALDEARTLVDNELTSRPALQPAM